MAPTRAVTDRSAAPVASVRRTKRGRPQRTSPAVSKSELRADQAWEPSPAPTGDSRPPRRAFSFLIQSIVIFLVTFVAHSSSLGNQYAFDDELIILRNIPVQRGISGIGEILTTDAYAGYYESLGGEAGLTGGRYRPLSAVTFAIEQSLFGRTLGDEYRAVLAEWSGAGSAERRPGELEARRNDVEREIEQANREIAFHRHLLQVALYAGSAVILLVFLRRVFPTSAGAAFIAALLFAVHPIHTEVVANIKSRDEILSLLFILLMGISLFEWDRTRRVGSMALAMVYLVLALLSKEYAVVAPVILASALILVRGRRIRAVATSTLLPLMIVVIVYVIGRQSLVGGVAAVDIATQDIINDPFLKLRTGEMSGSILATKIDVLDHYLRLLVVPHPHSSDYSYATFAYQTFTSPSVLLSLLIHVSLVVLTLFAWRRRHILALAGLVYLGFLLPVSNLVFEIGATLGERLIYHSSLGFALLLGWLITRLPRPIAVLACVAIAVPYGFASFARDRVWRDNRSLFLTDVRTVPRSALVNGNAGAQIVNEALDRVRDRRRSNIAMTPADREFVKKRAGDAIVYLMRAVSIHDRHVGGWTNLGIAHYYREEWEEAGEAFARVAAIAPERPALRQYATNFHMLGTALARSGDLEAATEMFRRAVAASPADVRLRTDYATAAFMALRFGEARAAFEQARAMDPVNPAAARGFASAAEFDRLTRATIERPDDPQAFDELAALLARNPQPAFAAAAERARATSERLRRSPQ